MERLGGVVVTGDAGVNRTAPDNEYPDRVITRLAQRAEHGLGPIRVIVSLGVLSSGIECRVIASGCSIGGS